MNIIIKNNNNNEYNNNNKYNNNKYNNNEYYNNNNNNKVSFGSNSGSTYNKVSFGGNHVGRGLYYHLWPAPPYNIFPHFLTNGTVFGKNKY